MPMGEIAAHRTLLILRHAKSARPEDVSDHDRPLTKRGKRDARRLGGELFDRLLVPDLVLTSTAKRARATTRRVAKALGWLDNGLADVRVAHEPRLYLGSLGDHLRVLSELPDTASTVLLVGHNPALEDLVCLLTGSDDHLPTGCLVAVLLPIASWAETGLQTRGQLYLRLAAKQL